jgi:hypothetical protein
MYSRTTRYPNPYRLKMRVTKNETHGWRGFAVIRQRDTALGALRGAMKFRGRRQGFRKLALAVIITLAASMALGSWRWR